MFIHRVAESLQQRGVPFAIVGGYAVALHGAVRGTVDLDIVLRLNRKDFVAAEAAFKSLGLASRLPVSAQQVFDFREEYIKHKNLAAWSFSNPANAGEIVDVIITHDLGKMRIKKIKVGIRVLPVLAIPDLIAMKRASGRPQDKEDIAALESL